MQFYPLPLCKLFWSEFNKVLEDIDFTLITLTCLNNVHFVNVYVLYLLTRRTPNVFSFTVPKRSLASHMRGNSSILFSLWRYVSSGFIDRYQPENTIKSTQSKHKAYTKHTQSISLPLITCLNSNATSIVIFLLFDFLFPYPLSRPQLEWPVKALWLATTHYKKYANHIVLLCCTCFLMWKCITAHDPFGSWICFFMCSLIWQHDRRTNLSECLVHHHHLTNKVNFSRSYIWFN